MKVTQPVHYIQANVNSRQNFHINSELIKRNGEIAQSQRAWSMSPQPRQIPNRPTVVYQPIQMTFNPANHSRRPSQVAASIESKGSQIYTGQMHNIISAPRNVVKMQQVNRSNSSSRVFSQNSRIQYISITGQPLKNNTSGYEEQVKNQILQHRIPQIAAPLNSIHQRPPSIIKNVSPQLKTKTIVYGQPTMENRFIDGNLPSNQIYRPNSPASAVRLVPSQPPNGVVFGQNIQKLNDGQRFTFRAQGRQNSDRAASPHPNNMRTSQVKILYQRGSYSPNQQKSPSSAEQLQIQQVDTSKAFHQKIQPQNKIVVKYDGHTSNKNINNVKISISQLKQRQQQGDKGSKNLNVNGNGLRLAQQIKSTAIQSIIVGQANVNQLTVFSPVNTLNARSATDGNKNPIQNGLKNNSQQESKSSASPKIAALKKSNSHQDMPVQGRNQSIGVSTNLKKPSIPQNGFLQKQPHQPANQELAKKAIDVGVDNGNGARQLRKVYKSYDQYLEQTKKPEKVIKQIQQSQHNYVSIQYRQAQVKNSPSNIKIATSTQNKPKETKQNINFVSSQEGQQRWRINPNSNQIELPNHAIKNVDQKALNSDNNLNEWEFQHQLSGSIPLVYGSTNIRNATNQYSNHQPHTQDANNYAMRSNEEARNTGYGYDVVLNSYSIPMTYGSFNKSEHTPKQQIPPQIGSGLNLASGNMGIENVRPTDTNQIDRNLKQTHIQPANIVSNQNNKNVNHQIGSSPAYLQPAYPPMEEYISTIREQSNQYDDEYQYEYSSSLIGSTLQDQLRIDNHSQFRDLSDLQPDSWLKNKYENMFTTHNPIPYQLSIQAKTGTDNKCVNPFQSIANGNNKIQQKQAYQERYGLILQNKPLEPENAHLGSDRVKTEQNYDKPSKIQLNEGKRYEYNEMHANRINSNGISANSINQQIRRQTQHNQQKQRNSYQLKIQTYSNNNLSTKDKLTSQKLLPFGNRMGWPNQPRASQSHSNIKSNRRIQVQNEEEQFKYETTQSSFDIYELIDDIYNRELQSGINRIREVFGRTISNPLHTH